ncbi:GntR family transcriptional regulator [Nocardioides jishulii]|uniref:GntR family transcriptional regulator n=1 Tax=Nocardioides jishulii TaxID=2575440 RepID=A0A4U2YMS7_9ACTN|nr:GntR family transcriptional regulator [Nocardioides jishulii]QCX27779.1 GntR family transcriptional regulator [Nocardioides jishulii]TKI62586.1 GntR family transcriptional regulator [Nocardioides jishulii]
MTLPFEVVIDPLAADPPFEQVRRQVAGAVVTGALVPGDKLPPVRTLAAALGLAVNTVARAYKELEAAGVVATRGRAGTVVLGYGTEQAARAAAAAYVAQARHLGLTDAEVLEHVRRALG